MSKRPVCRMLLTIVCLMLLQACQPRVPKQYLQPDELEDLLYDYYLSKGISEINHPSNFDYDHRYKTEAVLRKYDISQAEFDSTLAYYFNNAERLRPIYQNLLTRLSDDAIRLGASAGEVERFANQSLSGDTTDVWEGRRFMLLLPSPPQHLWQFSQKTDTTFRKGDSFLLTFDSHYLAQGGSKSATAYLAITYENDSVITQNAMLTAEGVTTLRINACPERAKRIDGFVYLNRRDTKDAQNSDMCLLFLSRLQLIRFHHPEVVTDTVNATKPDTLTLPNTLRVSDSVVLQSTETVPITPASPSLSNRKPAKHLKQL